MVGLGGREGHGTGKMELGVGLPGAAVTDPCELAGSVTGMCPLSVLGTGGPNHGVGRAVPPGGSEGEFVPSLSLTFRWWLAVLGLSLRASRLCLCPYRVSPSLGLYVSSPSDGTLVMGRRPILIQGDLFLRS